MKRLTQVLDPLNGTTGFGYDPNGNLLSVTDARSNATTYTYDNMGGKSGHSEFLGLTLCFRPTRNTRG